jgi:hypothetical protein
MEMKEVWCGGVGGRIFNQRRQLKRVVPALRTTVRAWWKY